MNDPFVIASIALGLSLVASAVRMVDWFLHADPRVAAQVTRWSVRGIAALSVPLLLVLLFKEQWTAATALGAAMVLVPAVLGRRLWRWVGVPSLASFAPVGAGAPHASGHSFADEAELVRYSAAVLEAYLRRTGATQRAVGGDVLAIADRIGENGGGSGKGLARRKGDKADKANGVDIASDLGDASGVNRHGHASGNGHAETFGLGPMSEEEACAVLGVDRGAGEAEIRAVHGRISAAVAPAQGGSPFLAVKVDQAKEVLLRAAAPSADAPSGAPRKRSASRRRPSPRA
jgi:hypothetical protein